VEWWELNKREPFLHHAFPFYLQTILHPRQRWTMDTLSKACTTQTASMLTEYRSLEVKATSAENPDPETIHGHEASLQDCGNPMLNLITRKAMIKLKKKRGHQPSPASTKRPDIYSNRQILLLSIQGRSGMLANSIYGCKHPQSLLTHTQKRMDNQQSNWQNPSVKRANEL